MVPPSGSGRQDDVVLPNPTDSHVIKAFERGAFREFERHSRIGMVSAGEGVHCHGFEPPRAGFDHFGGLA